MLKDRQYSLWDLAMKDRRASPFANVQSPLLVDAAFSPDGRWVVYQAGGARPEAQPSNQQSYVQPFPPTGAGYQVPTPLAGTNHPVWSRKGDAILAGIAINRDAAIPVTTTPRFVFGRPDEFARGARLVGLPTRTRRNWDPMPDGRTLGVMSAGSRQTGNPGAPQIAVVLNWFDELRQRVR